MLGQNMTIAEIRQAVAAGDRFYFHIQYEFASVVQEGGDRDLASGQGVNRVAKTPRKWSATRVKSGVVVVILLTIYSQDTRIVVDHRTRNAIKDLCEILGVTHTITAED